MDYKIQLLSFFASFIYGIFFFYTNITNQKIIKRENAFLKYVITFLYILNIIILYIIIIYKINCGIFHIYFLITLIIGYIFGYLSFKKSKKYVKLLKQYFKNKKRML